MKNNNTKIDVIRRVMAQGSICCQNCQGYRFIVLDIFLVFTSAQAKNKAFALAITLVRTS